MYLYNVPRYVLPSSVLRTSMDLHQGHLKQYIAAVTPDATGCTSQNWGGGRVVVKMLNAARRVVSNGPNGLP